MQFQKKAISIFALLPLYLHLFSTNIKMKINAH